MALFNRFIHKLRSDFFLSLTEKPTTLQVAVGAFAPLSTILLIIGLSKNVPYYDQWYFVPLLDSFHTGNVTFAALWEQHNEHRLVFPLLLMLAPASLTHWNVQAEIVFGVVLAIATFLFLCRAIDHTVIRTKSSKRDNRKRPYALYSLLSVLPFSTLQGSHLEENL